MPANLNFNTKFYQKIKFLRMKMMCLLASNKKKIGRKTFFLASLKSMKKEVGSRVGSGAGAGHGSGSIIGTDPGIQIRTKMSRIPNTAFIGSLRINKNPAVHSNKTKNCTCVTKLKVF
jgi:hypothetical protein